MSDRRDWAEDDGEVFLLANVLFACEVFDTPKDVIDFFEKPWKWTAEHNAWNQLGRPLGGDLSEEEIATILKAGTDDAAHADTEPPRDEAAA